MSFQPVNDRLAGRSSRLYKQANGTHFGHSPVDQPDGYAYVTDLDCWQNRLQLRAGARKNEMIGYNGTVEAAFNINVLERGLLGVVVNGTLTVYPTDDILNGVQRYYTWAELRNTFTWEELQGKTWRDLIIGK